MAPSDLDIGLLYKITDRAAKARGTGPSWFQLSTGDLMDLVPPDVATGMAALDYLQRHVEFLKDVGLLRLSPAGIHTGMRLTTKGEMFVQPELAEFGRKPLLPEVVKTLENDMQILTYPQEEKDRMLYRLREAVAKQAPDLIAKVIAEIGFRIIQSGR